MIEQFLNQILKEPKAKTLKKAKLEVIDWIGYSIAGTKTTQAKPFYNLQKYLPDGQTLNLFSKKKLNIYDSAFINASAGNILELDDVHRTSIIHPGDTIIPATIAASSSIDIDAYNFLRAIIIGYETAIRMGKCLGIDHYKIFYSSATCGVFGAAAASSYILNYKNNLSIQLRNLNASIQLSTMTSSGVWQCRKGDGEAKQYALANASRAGLTSAFLAQNDATTPVDMIEGELGFLRGFAKTTDYSELIKEYDCHLIDEVSNKPWAACRHSHPVIGVSLESKKEINRLDLDLDNIDEIKIETYQTAIDFCNKKNPQNDIEGKFSLQHCCALSLIYENILENYFKDNFLYNNSIKKIRDKIKLIPNNNMTNDFPENYSASLEIKFKNGFKMKKICLDAKGDPENPMTEKEICDKTIRLINSNDSNKVELLIKKIIDTDDTNDHSPITWFNDLQEVI
jgi:2-methylcitrate dehydratase PrpD